MMTEKVEYQNEYCKYEFSSEERGNIAETLAIKTQELEEVEAEKKSVVANFKEKLETVQMEIKSAARKYKDGYEMRNIECIVERDFEVGIVKYIRTDTGEVARTTKMTMAQRQRRIEELEEDIREEEVEKTDEEIAAQKATESTMQSESSAL